MSKTNIFKAIKYRNKFQNTILNYSKQTLAVKNVSKCNQNQISFNKNSPNVPPNVETITSDMIGPPHPISNLRPIIRHKAENETPLQKKLRDLQNETQVWNQTFWEKHNTKFIKEKEDYIMKKSNGEKPLSAEEMSDFYKEFLDKNWIYHVNYNFSWYKKNFRILFLSLGVQIQTLFQNKS